MPYKHSERYLNNKFLAADIGPAFQVFLRDPSGATPPEEVGATDWTELLKAFFSKPWGMGISSGNPATAIPNGTYGPIYVPHNMTLSAARIVAIPITGETTGSITFDVYVDTYGNWPPTVGDSIVGGGTKPAISAAVKAEDLDISDFADLTLVGGSRALFVVSGCTNLWSAELTFDNVRTA